MKVSERCGWWSAGCQFTQFALLWLLVDRVVCDKSQEVEIHMERGKIALSKGQFADALQHYHAAVELDPSNYQIYFRRATVLLATGKVKAAIPDLDKVVELKPDFIALRSEPENSDAKAKLQKVQELAELIELADEHLTFGDYSTAEGILDKAIEECMWDPDLHRKRAKCRKARGDIQNAISDIRAIAKLVPDSTEVYLESAEMYYDVGDIENSLLQIRECLKLNPDDKKCFPFYKRVKKLAKLREDLAKLSKNEKWMDCLAKGQDILKFESKIDSVQLDVFRYTCRCNKEAGHIAEAIQECTEVLNNADPNDLEVLCDRAEAYILNEQFDKGAFLAVEDYQKAVNAHEDSRKAKEGLNKAQKLLKQSQKKDYYKILGVRRNANKREIMKAYRKLAQKWHPDNFQSDEEKQRAQEKFIDIANAKEVLTDPEKREKFDHGEDPLDPSAQTAHQQGWHHFHQGFNGFQGFPGGGGQQYTFKFTNF
ncbi:Tetratricopeptide repeat protein [Aphelenchoides besseyi]|nr:Tetratricopeptide repeat protein [Aphelenchoides besseyi]